MFECSTDTKSMAHNKFFPVMRCFAHIASESYDLGAMRVELNSTRKERADALPPDFCPYKVVAELYSATFLPHWKAGPTEKRIVLPAFSTSLKK